jgi:hypothetical protein
MHHGSTEGTEVARKGIAVMEENDDVGHGSRTYDIGLPGVGMGLVQHPTNLVSEKVIGAAMEMHRNLGPGLLESSYHACLRRELELRGVVYQPIHSSQLMTYMRLCRVSSGLLMNFNVELLPHGINRILV